MWIYFCYVLIGFVLSSILLVTLKTILEKKEVDSIQDERFSNYFLIVMTIFIVLVLMYFKLK